MNVVHERLRHLGANFARHLPRSQRAHAIAQSIELPAMYLEYKHLHKMIKQHGGIFEIYLNVWRGAAGCPRANPRGSGHNPDMWNQPWGYSPSTNRRESARSRSPRSSYYSSYSSDEEFSPKASEQTSKKKSEASVQTDDKSTSEASTQKSDEAPTQTSGDKSPLITLQKVAQTFKTALRNAPLNDDDDGRLQSKTHVPAPACPQGAQSIAKDVWIIVGGARDCDQLQWVPRIKQCANRHSWHIDSLQSTQF